VLVRMRFEEEIAAENIRLAVSLLSIGDVFMTIDQVGRVLMLNAIAERLLGRTQEEAAGRPLAEVFQLLDENTRRCPTAELERLVATGSASALGSSTVLQSHDGGERLIEITAAPIRDKTKRTGAVLVFRDVTARAHAEEERRKAEKLESLGLAAGGIAHDFNNLLTSILGNISLALYLPDLEIDLSERLISAKKATLRAQELAQQLLTFAKGGAPIKQSASIAQLLHDTVTFSLRGSAVKGEFDIPDDLWSAEVDAGQISQVVSNLTINADQAMPAGGTLRVACANFTLSTDNDRMGLRAGRYVIITVQDQGIGIPEENIKKIFDPYFSTKPKGSGLGLATAYSIVKSHEGVIDVTSRSGEGTTFHLFLPATDKPPAIEPEIPEQTVAPYHARVLVLDDEESICTLVSCALGPLGYEVTEAHDALSAIDAYETALHEGRRFDIVISDLTLPGGIGGKEAVRRLHAIDPDVKAIVSSGYHSDPVMSNYREYGFCAVIAKPYELEALGRVVAEVLAKAGKKNVIPHNFDAQKSA
jgi:PAS domain S-box-containing protein